ncbi:MAG: hypothetical protein KGH49_00390 [Candidatus Micrarchaeota archaeon]|nr:hypothetical protein [Candidatus Micrarchaeota archaeon]
MSAKDVSTKITYQAVVALTQRLMNKEGKTSGISLETLKSVIRSENGGITAKVDPKSAVPVLLQEAIKLNCEHAKELILTHELYMAVREAGKLTDVNTVIGAYLESNSKLVEEAIHYATVYN